MTSYMATSALGNPRSVFSVLLSLPPPQARLCWYPSSQTLSIWIRSYHLSSSHSITCLDLQVCNLESLLTFLFHCLLSLLFCGHCLRNASSPAPSFAFLPLSPWLRLQNSWSSCLWSYCSPVQCTNSYPIKLPKQDFIACTPLFKTFPWCLNAHDIQWPMPVMSPLNDHVYSMAHFPVSCTPSFLIRASLRTLDLGHQFYFSTPLYKQRTGRDLLNHLFQLLSSTEIPSLGFLTNRRPLLLHLQWWEHSKFLIFFSCS